ncbi:hypothetical protein SEUCBS139899_005881 [Sporothrix eucalyptigena]
MPTVQPIVPTTTTTVIYPAQQPIYTAVNPMVPGNAALVQPQAVGWPCEHMANVTELRSLPAPPPGRPGQWIQWCNGSVTWLAAPIETL